MATPPAIVNLVPSPDEDDVSVAEFVRFTLRDLETHVAAGELQVTAGYAKIHSNGEERFEDTLPRTSRSSVLSGALSSSAPTIEASTGVTVTKTVNTPQRSVYFTSIDAGAGHKSALVTGIMEPSVSDDATGAVLGLEHGPRDTAAYLFFDSPGGAPRLRLVGPADASGVRVPDVPIAHDWSLEVSRYLIVWNEVRSLVEVYAITSSASILLAAESISNFQAFDTNLGAPTPKRGGTTDITGIYGIEGDSGDSVTIHNIAVTTDVGFPFVGISRPGNFLTVRRSDETVRYSGGDMRRLQVSPWNDPATGFLATVSPSGAITITREGASRITKKEPGTTFSLWREEPGFLRTTSEGLILEASFFGIPSQVENSRITGMGFLIWDGTTAFSLMLLEGELRNVGLLRADAVPNQIASYTVPTKALSWGSPTTLRFTVDPRRALVELYGEDIVTPVLSIPLNRAALPDDADMGFTDEPPFIAIGHTTETDTAGSLDISRLAYSHLYQAYEARDGAEPDNGLLVDPVWAATGGGFNTFGPLFGALLGGGFGIMPLGYFTGSGGAPAGNAAILDDTLQINTAPGETIVYSRAANFGIERGAVLESRLRVTKFKPKARSGFFLILDDGLVSYMLSFVDTDIGRFVAIPMRSGLSSFSEIVGTEGEGARFSVRIDWTEFHTYRLERRSRDGLYLFIDGEQALVIPDSAQPDYPDTQFAQPTVSFGHFTTESTVSELSFVRTMFGTGYEISFRKVDPLLDLEEEVRGTQAVVVAYAEDVDP